MLGMGTYHTANVVQGAAKFLSALRLDLLSATWLTDSDLAGVVTRFMTPTDRV